MSACASRAECALSACVSRAEHVSSFSWHVKSWASHCLHMLQELSVCLHVSVHIEV